jgi:hypothetical protein
MMQFSPKTNKETSLSVLDVSIYLLAYEDGTDRVFHNVGI